MEAPVDSQQVGVDVKEEGSSGWTLGSWCGKREAPVDSLLYNIIKHFQGL